MSFGFWKGDRMEQAMYLQDGNVIMTAGGQEARVLGDPKEDSVYANGCIVDTNLGRMYYSRDQLLEVVG